MKNKLRAEVEVVELKSRTTRGATNVLPPTTKEGPKRKEGWRIPRNICPGVKEWSRHLFNEREKRKRKKEKDKF